MTIKPHTCYVCAKPLSDDAWAVFRVRGISWDLHRFTHITCDKAMWAICMLEGAKILDNHTAWSR